MTKSKLILDGTPIQDLIDYLCPTLNEPILFGVVCESPVVCVSVCEESRNALLITLWEVWFEYGLRKSLQDALDDFKDSEPAKELVYFLWRLCRDEVHIIEDQKDEAKEKAKQELKKSLRRN